jgi:anti-sigma regulatory factor (Ser/Thr protein kinase)/RimJ/RimL family protein N-acetyltransferase
MKESRIVLIFPAEKEYIPVSQNAARVLAVQCGFEDSQANRIALALEESFIYAIEMGYEGVRGEIRITLSSTSMGLKIEIHSSGLPLNPDQLPAYSPEKALKHQDLHGLSFFLVKKLMDRVSFSVQRNGKRKMTMLKQFTLDDNRIQAGKSQPPENAGKAVKLIQEPDRNICHRIRPAVPEDAEEIARIAMLSHGSILFNEDIYYPARVKEMIQSGEMVSVVAVTGDDVLFAHGALVALGSDRRVEELTYGFVHPDFRGRKVNSEIARSLIDSARDRGIHAVQALSVTSHVHSQKAILKYGFIETALLMATSPGACNWKKNEGTEPDRIGNLLQVKYLGNIKSPVLFVPSRHRQIIQEIYSRVDGGVQFSIQSQNPAVIPDESRILSESDFVEGWGFICVLEYGRDVENKVQESVQEAIQLDLVAIHLLLPMDSPATPYVASVFESRGFFFAGVGPGDDAREYFALQYINREIGYDAIHVLEGMGERIKDYVIECGKRAIKTFASTPRQSAV